MKTPHDTPSVPPAPCTSHEMHGRAPVGSPDTWVFNIEAVATLCIAGWYVLGVFISLGVLPNGRIYQWGSTWVVPLLLGVFYLGAGYLYQRYQRIYSLTDWGRYMRREIIVLATPFVAFTVLTLAANSLLRVSPAFTPADLGLALTVSPVVPVGYFEVLAFIYVLTRTPRTRRGMAALLAVALAAKALVALGTDAGLTSEWAYLAHELPSNWVWFVAGVAVSFYDLESWLEKPLVAGGSTVAFAALGAALFFAGVTHATALALLTAAGLLVCFSVSAARFGTGRQDRFFAFVTRYTMAIWLMHELLARLVLAGLAALGFSATGTFAPLAAPVCTAACLLACYPLPVLAMWALSKVGKLGFIVYPGRYLPKEL